MAQLAPSPSENARWYIRSQWLRLNRALVLCVTVGLFGLLGGCASGRVWWGDTVGYYWQSSVGHLTLMMQAERIETLLQDPDLTQPATLIMSCRRVCKWSIGIFINPTAIGIS